MSAQPPYPPALLAAARDLCNWAQVPEAAEAVRADVATILARHWPTPAPETAALAAEVERLKTGIKNGEVTMIVDGGDMCDWMWMTHRDANARIAKAVAAAGTAPAPLPPGYLSFLLCLLGYGTPRQTINAYVNGQPLGTIDAAGTFQPHERSMPDGSKQATRFRDLGEPQPFGSLEELREFLHEVVDRLELPEPLVPQAATDRA